MAPPISAPQATAMPAMPPQMPTTVPRRSIVVVRIVRLSGMIMPAPIPWTIRATMRTSMLAERAHAADVSANNTRPIANNRRRPNLSPSAAAVVMLAA